MRRAEYYALSTITNVQSGQSYDNKLIQLNSHDIWLVETVYRVILLNITERENIFKMIRILDHLTTNCVAKSLHLYPVICS